MALFVSYVCECACVHECVLDWRMITGIRAMPNPFVQNNKICLH